MRFSPHLTDNPHLQRFVGPTAVFLDTTYCKPQYTFPPQVHRSIRACLSLCNTAAIQHLGSPDHFGLFLQEEVVEHVASTMQKMMEEDINHRRLYLIQTYCIGKERLFLEVRTALLEGILYSAAATNAHPGASSPDALCRLAGCKAVQMQAVCEQEETRHHVAARPPWCGP